MPERKTVGQLMEEMRLKAGARTTTATNTWICNGLPRTPGT